MDPNANLAEQEQILKDRAPGSRANAGRLRELRNALAAWLHGGGFEPKWDDCPLAAPYWRLMRQSLARRKS